MAREVGELSLETQGIHRGEREKGTISQKSEVEFWADKTTEYTQTSLSSEKSTSLHILLFAK